MKANIKNGIELFLKLPKVWKDDQGRTILNFDQSTTEFQHQHGFRDVVEPTPFDPSTQKFGKPIHDQTNDVVTYEVITRPPDEIELERINKQQAEKEKIYKAKLDKFMEDQVKLTPITDIDFYDEWQPGTYQIPDRRQYKGKLFEVITANTATAPNKGGWKEIKQ